MFKTTYMSYYIEFHTAKLANKIGFYYANDSDKRYTKTGKFQKPENQGWSITAPTQEGLHNWIRVNYKILIVPSLCEDFKYKVTIINFQDKIDLEDQSMTLAPFESYKQAYEEGLLKALKLIQS